VFQKFKFYKARSFFNAQVNKFICYRNFNSIILNTDKHSTASLLACQDFSASNLNLHCERKPWFSLFLALWDVRY
jgi:hypothetical protein